MSGIGSNEVSTNQLQPLVDAMGEELLAAFCECLIHADRLTSLLHMLECTEAQHSATSVAYQRNLLTVHWFICGTLWEARDAVAALRRAAKRSRTLRGPKWDELQRLVDSWETEKWIIRVRNNIAFHVDGKLIRRGLRDLAANSRPVLLFKLDGESEANSMFGIGLEALFAGLKIDENDMQSVLKIVADSCNKFSTMIQEFFVDEFQATGGRLEAQVDDEAAPK